MIGGRFFQSRGRSARCSRRLSDRRHTSGGGDPQWLSNHPNPGNRTEYIAGSCVPDDRGPLREVSGFERVKMAFASLSPAKSMGDLARAKSTSRDPSGLAGGNAGGWGKEPR